MANTRQEAGAIKAELAIIAAEGRAMVEAIKTELAVIAAEGRAMAKARGSHGDGS